MYQLVSNIRAKVSKTYRNKVKDKTGLQRSGKWAETRDLHLSLYPSCAICGNTKKVEVHHIIPFHVDPSKELEPSNLISLCEGWKLCNCHLVFGHLGNYKQYNGQVKAMAEVLSKGIVNNENIK